LAFSIIVEAVFIGNILKKQEATGDANSEAEDIEDGKAFSLRQISQRKRQVIFEHVVSVFLVCGKFYQM